MIKEILSTGNDYRLHFINLKNGNLTYELINEIKAGLWKRFNIEAFLYNDSLTPDQLHLQKPVYEGYQQVVPGNKWNTSNNRLEQIIYHPHRCNCSFTEFIDQAAKFFDGLNANRIGVHLSGGLDSSIVICLLSHLGIPFVPIGIRANTYEFRTERRIQEKLLELGDNGLLIDYQECPFYSNIDKLPIHSMPTGTINSYCMNERLSDEFAKRGCDVVISGQGGDTLFVDGCESMENLSFNIGDEFQLEDAQRMSYAPRGIRLQSFYSHKPIINIISSAREGKKDDPLKLWARKWCKSILPRELVDYSYIGDFFALSMKGLNESMPLIKKLLDNAYDISENKLFSPSVTSKLCSTDIYNFEVTPYTNFCSILAVAVWYNSLQNI